MSSRRPNFVVFLSDQHRADQHRADLLGCAGHPVLRTPHIDSIARRGVRMDRFYVANPVCMPRARESVGGRGQPAEKAELLAQLVREQIKLVDQAPFSTAPA